MKGRTRGITRRVHHSSSRRRDLPRTRLRMESTKTKQALGNPNKLGKSPKRMISTKRTRRETKFEEITRSSPIHATVTTWIRLSSTSRLFKTLTSTIIASSWTPMATSCLKMSSRTFYTIWRNNSRLTARKTKMLPNKQKEPKLHRSEASNWGSSSADCRTALFRADLHPRVGQPQIPRDRPPPSPSQRTTHLSTSPEITAASSKTILMEAVPPAASNQDRKLLMPTAISNITQAEIFCRMWWIPSWTIMLPTQTRKGSYPMPQEIWSPAFTSVNKAVQTTRNRELSCSNSKLGPLITRTPSSSGKGLKTSSIRNRAPILVGFSPGPNRETRVFAPLICPKTQRSTWNTESLKQTLWPVAEELVPIWMRTLITIMLRRRTLWISTI